MIFRSSANLTHAYGLAVYGTMVITAIFVTWILILRGQVMRSVIAVVLLGITTAFLVANFDKIPYGGYWSLVIAAIPFGIVLIFVQGQKKLAAALSPVPLDEFLKKFKDAYTSLNRISGTALFFARDFRALPQYIPRIMFTNRIIYDDNIIVSITRTEEPFGITWGVTREVTEGFSIFEIYAGYMEFVNIANILKEAEIEELTIFYGIEDVITTNLVWRVFAAIKRLSPSILQFYKLPPDKIHGVVTRVEM